MSSRPLEVGMAVNAYGVVFFGAFCAEILHAFQPGVKAEVESDPVPVSEPTPVEPISEPAVLESRLMPQKVKLVAEPIEAQVISMDAWRRKHAA